MELSIRQRIERIRNLKQEFRLDQNTIAEYSGKSRTTVSIVLVESDERYLTDSNVTAIERGIEKILAEYRSKLCGPNNG